MNSQPLDFEKPIVELEQKLGELRGHSRENNVNLDPEVRRMEDEYPGVGLFQRFLVMNDPAVGRFLVRDCDARLSAAEADLVRAWIDSSFTMRPLFMM